MPCQPIFVQSHLQPFWSLDLQGCVGELSLLMVKAGGGNTAVNDHLQQVTSEFQHIAAIFCSQGPEVQFASPGAFSDPLTPCCRQKQKQAYCFWRRGLQDSDRLQKENLRKVWSICVPNHSVKACSSNLNRMQLQEAARATWQGYR